MGPIRLPMEFMDTGKLLFQDDEERLLAQARWLAGMIEEADSRSQIGMMQVFSTRLETILAELDEFYELEAMRRYGASSFKTKE